MKSKVLKLNSYYFPVDTCDFREAIKNIFSNAAYPLDIQYEQGEKGETLESFEWFEPIKTWADWAKLPVRLFDECINTTKGKVRLPSVVVCADYSRVKWNKVLFPTKHNIWERDNWTCQYTGRKLTRDEISVDHIIPKSKGGQDTWFNLVACCKEINRKKADKMPEDFHLHLKRQPFIPKGGMVFPVLRPEWTKFIAESN